MHMSLWHPLRSGRAVLATTVVLGAMAVAATPVGASTTAPGASLITCGSKTVTPHPAPGVGNTEQFTVGSGGTVTLLQETNTTLKVTSARAAQGWKVNVVTNGTSTRPHVGFQRIGVPADQERFWARMNTAGTPGTVINVVIQSCT
jgi:hypothetical protein